MARRGCSGGAVAPEPATPPLPVPPPSTLIPLCGVFDQQLTTGLCDSYHKYAEVRPRPGEGWRGELQVVEHVTLSVNENRYLFTFFSDLLCSGFHIHHSQCLSRTICCSLLYAVGESFQCVLYSARDLRILLLS
jgi:hypothetical protein